MDPIGLLFYLVAFLIFGGIYAILCLALNVQWGFGGLFNAGIAGFFAVGAYTSALLTAQPSETHVGGFDLPVPLVILAGAIPAGMHGSACATMRMPRAPSARMWMPSGCRPSSSVRR